MNVNVYKILIVAFLVFHLSWETSAAPIEGETPEGSIDEQPSAAPIEDEASCASIDEETSAAPTEEDTSCGSSEGISES